MTVRVLVAVLRAGSLSSKKAIRLIAGAIMEELKSFCCKSMSSF